LIINKIKESEIKILQDKIKQDSLFDIKPIADKFNIRLNIPVKYKMVLKGKNSFGLKKKLPVAT